MEKSNSGLINFGVILILMMFLSFLKIVDSGFLNMVGDSFLLLSMIIIFLISIVNHRFFLNIEKKLFFSLFPILFLSLIYFINFFVSINPLISLQRSFLIFLIIIVMVFFYRIGIIDKSKILKTKLYYLLCLIAILIVAFYVIKPTLSSYQSFFLNANAFGMYVSLLFLGLVAIGTDRFKIVIFFIGLFFVFVSSSRSSLLAYFAASLFIIFGHFVYSNKKIYNFIIYTLILIAIAIVYFMAYLDLTNYNELVRAYTGKNLLSGRNEVWPYVLNLTQQYPIFGWGGGVSLSDVSSYNFSSHNFYLHTALQVGYFGVFLVFIFYINFWKFIWSNQRSKDIYNANALFIWLILIQNFEVTLLQNNLVMSVPILCLISYIAGNSSIERIEM